MGQMLLAIDPGADSGWALFDSTAKTLVDCGLGAAPLKPGITEVIVEKPTIYPRMKARPADVVTLAVRAGEAAGRVFGALGSKIVYTEPRTWKGSVPKEAHQKRVLGALAPRETAILKRTLAPLAATKRHNVVDAIGLGLWFLGRGV